MSAGHSEGYDYVVVCPIMFCKSADCILECVRFVDSGVYDLFFISRYINCRLAGSFHLCLIDYDATNFSVLGFRV